MDYQKQGSGWVFWNGKILIPVTKEDGTRGWFSKEIPFEDTPNYWEYVLEEDVWNIYYVKRGC